MYLHITHNFKEIAPNRTISFFCNVFRFGDKYFLSVSRNTYFVLYYFFSCVDILVHFKTLTMFVVNYLFGSSPYQSRLEELRPLFENLHNRAGSFCGNCDDNGARNELKNAANAAQIRIASMVDTIQMPIDDRKQLVILKGHLLKLHAGLSKLSDIGNIPADER